MMQISQGALAKAEPLFTQFIDSMWCIAGYHVQAFQARHDSRDLYSETLRVLNSYQQDRSRAAYCLIINGLVWDAEIIIRTLYEAFSKTAFLATANEDRRGTLLAEYWEILSSIYDRQGALKAKAAESLSKRFGTEGDTRIFSSLRDSDLFQTEPIGNKRLRNEVEQRWSFSGIINALRSGKLGSVRLAWIDGLAHMYGMSSNLAHASPKAFDLMDDRAQRGDDLVHLEVGHICRMLSDMVSLTSFSIYLSERSWTGNEEMPVDLATAFQRMSDATEPYQAEFHASQDALYPRTPGDRKP